MKLLDCTLRDGGYYTNWDFESQIVENYVNSFNHLPVDYLEIGYRSVAMKGYLGEFYYCPPHVMEAIRSRSEKKLVIILNEKDISREAVKDLLSPCSGLIDMVRIAIDPANFRRALDMAERVKALGFEVGFNVMYMSSWRERGEFIGQIKFVNGLADYFYMVDSYGGVYPDDVINTIDLVREQTSVKLGFHGHNNLELGLINSLTALEHGVEMVDATVTGMGRGAGNLKMELLLTILSSQGKVDVDFNLLSKVVDPFVELQEKYGWGTNLPYMVSGAHSLPQKQVMEWVSKRYFSFNSIIRALANQSQGLKDNQELPLFEAGQTGGIREVMIIGGGPSAVQHASTIRQFLRSRPDMVIIHASSRNAMNYHGVANQQLFCLVGNEGHRLEDVFGDASKVNGKCILPAFPRKMGTYVPQALHNKAYELPRISFTDIHQDTHTALAIQTAIELGARKIFVAGYDGYVGATMGQKEQDFFRENEALFRLAAIAGLECVSLTSTAYTTLKHDSIYSLI